MSGIGTIQTDKVRDYGIEPTCDKPRKRPWPVTAVGLLLLLQAVVLFGIGAFYFAAVYLLDLWAPLSALSIEELFLGVLDKTLMSTIFIPLSLLAVLAAISFLRLQRNAWTNAMLLQGLTLLIALLLYFSGKPWYVYILMLYSIFMVLYLNYHDVQMTFRSKPLVENQEEVPQGCECRGETNEH